MDKHLERLMNTTTKYYKDLLLILNDLTSLIRIKQSLTNNEPSAPQVSATTTSNNQNNLLFLLDDFITFDFNNGNNFTGSNQSCGSNNLDDVLTKKIQILDDENFLREFKNTLIPSNLSLIPNDLIRLVKTINENSSYLNSALFSNSKDCLKLIEDRLNAIKDEIEEKKACLYSVFNFYNKFKFFFK
jgi:hypothetical protein